MPSTRATSRAAPARARPMWWPRVRSTFALGTDTAGSGRVPAGLNNIVGIKPSRGLLSAFGVVPAAQSADCVSIFARTVGLAVDVLLAAAGPDARDPYSRELALRSDPFPSAFRFGVPDTLSFFGDVEAEAAFRDAQARLVALGGTPVTIPFAPLAEAAALLYESALVAERYAAVRGFFDAHGSQVIEPVRGILESGRGYSAADVFEAQTRLRALAQQVEPMWRGIDVLLVPTAPTHYTRDQMRADPVVLNRNLGAYTNFVNLLDYAAISVPSSLRADGLPFGITLIAPCGSDLALADLGQRYHHATGPAAGRHRLAAARAARHSGPGRFASADHAHRRRRRTPFGHAAQRPAHRARRHAAACHDHRAALPASCIARHRAAQAGAAAQRRRRQRHRARSVVGSGCAGRQLPGPDSASAGARQRGACRRQLGARLHLRRPCAGRCRRREPPRRLACLHREPHRLLPKPFQPDRSRSLHEHP